MITTLLLLAVLALVLLPPRLDPAIRLKELAERMRRERDRA